jgi:hypothetical protein
MLLEKCLVVAVLLCSEQVDMIAFAVDVHQLGLKIGANLGENMSQLLDSPAVEDAAAVH